MYFCVTCIFLQHHFSFTVSPPRDPKAKKYCRDDDEKNVVDAVARRLPLQTGGVAYRTFWRVDTGQRDHRHGDLRLYVHPVSCALWAFYAAGNGRRVRLFTLVGSAAEWRGEGPRICALFFDSAEVWRVRPAANEWQLHRSSGWWLASASARND